jgi:hypothetical protein
VSATARMPAFARRRGRAIDEDLVIDRVIDRIYALWPVWLGLFYAMTGVLFMSAHVVIGDAVARLVSARLVLSGYEPHGQHVLGYSLHLAGIGFVWGPLPALLDVPIVALSPLFPSLLTEGYGGAFMSAPFAAWGAWSVFQLVLERTGSRAWARLLTAGVALSPFIIIFAGNGMSEAMYLAFLFAALRALSRWQLRSRISDLAAAGCWLGLDCLVRFEVLAAAAGALLFVAVLGLARRWDLPRRVAVRRVSVDCLVLGLPVAFMFGLFIAGSWWVTGTALGQFTSVYGQSAQLFGYGSALYPAQRVPQVAKELFGIAPLLPLVVLLVAAPGRLRRNSIVPVVLAVLGPALLFDIESLSTGSVFNLVRYMILGVPICVLSLLALRGWGRIGYALALVGVAVVAVSGWIVIGDRNLANQEVAYREAVLGQPAAAADSDLHLDSAKQVAAWFDAQNLPDGSILVDTDVGFMVLAETTHPRRFVTPVYRGFMETVQYPLQHGIQYVVTIPPTGPGALETLNRYYPGLYDGCVQQAQLALTVDGTGVPTQWRVYRILKPMSPWTITYDSACPVRRVVL